MKEIHRFWNWARDENTGERVLYLEGAISEESWADDDITPSAFRSELFAGKGPITIWLSSPGGDVVAASEIYSFLLDYPWDVTVKIHGVAASAASVLAMAGTRVLIAPTAYIFLHNPFTVAMGDSDEMQKAAAMLGVVKDGLLNAYELRTGLSRAKLSHMLDAETWLSAQQAVDLRFADGILFEDKIRTPTTDSSAIGSSIAAGSGSIFSQRAVMNSLIECMRRKLPRCEVKPPDVAAPSEPLGIPLETLNKRLHLLSH